MSEIVMAGYLVCRACGAAVSDGERHTCTSGLAVAVSYGLPVCPHCGHRLRAIPEAGASHWEAERREGGERCRMCWGSLG